MAPEMANTFPHNIQISTMEPFLCFLSGIVISQFLRFCVVRKTDARKDGCVKALARVSFGLHLLQVAAEIWILYASLVSQNVGKINSNYIFEAIRTGFTLCVALMVQIHFSRIAYALLKNSKTWVIIASILGLLTCGGGIGTITLFLLESVKEAEEVGHRAQLGGELTGFYLAWLTAALAFNVTISSVIISALHLQTRSGLKKTTREITFRLMALTMETFALASITALLSIIFVSFGSFVDTRSRPHSIDFESCVASWALPGEELIEA
ncbi:uncharacterized protein MELLADRAFT_104936 [Melampsora larici-populina 98AG31]|uniref:Uncharacterized protein n=1 Tax=Melampsora larici-populina (strain 98AG31 / pathotype 3-4-7) TaxID=747676 RepID=F4RGK2_MELLP|nr:uncharacterized protein MELLADRAFT_104936 [Melampsora larici-populina 98AG31]EGG08635.1 hypothetical protein MELLADRAFT_104936 [Melampsora larici-populina 98AG31]